MCSRSISSQFNFSELDFSYIIGYQYVYRQYQYSLFFLNFFFVFLKSKEDFQQVENKYLEISKVWSYTEKILTKIIYAREAEQSIKDFYFDQVVELRQVFSIVLIG